MTTTQAELSELKWLLIQARDYYDYSKAKRTPGARATNRRKFKETVKHLLTLADAGTITAWVRGPRPGSDSEDALAIINELAGHKAAAESSRPADDLLTCHLAAATAKLIQALKLLKGGAA